MNWWIILILAIAIILVIVRILLWFGKAGADFNDIARSVERKKK